jgi:hypothetical protein
MVDDGACCWISLQSSHGRSCHWFLDTSFSLPKKNEKHCSIFRKLPVQTCHSKRDATTPSRRVAYSVNKKYSMLCPRPMRQETHRDGMAVAVHRRRLWGHSWWRLARSDSLVVCVCVCSWGPACRLAPNSINGQRLSASTITDVLGQHNAAKACSSGQAELLFHKR